MHTQVYGYPLAGFLSSLKEVEREFNILCNSELLVSACESKPEPYGGGRRQAEAELRL